MVRFATYLAISALIVVVLAFAIGSWWTRSPIPTIDPPQELVSDDPSTLDDDEALWNKEILDRFEEPSLRSNVFADHEVYRLILIPAFHAPILVRASRRGDKFELTTKVLDGLASNTQRAMTEAEWQRLLLHLDETSFWSMTTIDQREDIPNDRVIWLLEGRRESIVHGVRRLMPKPKLLELSKYFLQLAGKEADYTGYRQ